MKPRTLSVFLLPALLGFAAPAIAGRPEGPAAKLLANPVIPAPAEAPGSGGQGPAIQCGGFTWIKEVENEVPEPYAPIVLDLALVPFRSSATVLNLSDATGRNVLVRLGFNNGSVIGAPGLRYRRFAWNNVVVILHAVQQEYLVRVNGVEAGPFPYPDACSTEGGCYGLSRINLHGGLNDPGEAWMDSIAVTRRGAAGDESLLQIDFDTCYQPNDVVGGLLVMNPPRWLIPPIR